MSEEKKLFGRHHDLFLLLVGFFFTSIVGAALGSYFQNRSWDYQERARLMTSEREAATKVFEEVSKLMDRRIYRMRQLNWKVRGSRQETEMQEHMKSYREVLYEWNDSLNRNRALVKRYFGSAIESELTNNTHDKFKQVGRLLESYFAGRDTRDDTMYDRIDSGLEELEHSVYNLNLKMITSIQRGEVGAFHPEFKGE